MSKSQTFCLEWTKGRQKEQDGKECERFRLLKATLRDMKFKHRNEEHEDEKTNRSLLVFSS